MPPAGRYEHRVTASLFLFFVGAAFLNYNFSFFLLNPDAAKEGSDTAAIAKTYTCYPPASGNGT